MRACVLVCLSVCLWSVNEYCTATQLRVLEGGHFEPTTTKAQSLLHKTHVLLTERKENGEQPPVKEKEKAVDRNQQQEKKERERKKQERKKKEEEEEQEEEEQEEEEQEEEQEEY